MSLNKQQEINSNATDNGYKIYLEVLFLKVPFFQSVRRHIPKDHKFDTAMVILNLTCRRTSGLYTAATGVDVDMRLINLEYNCYTIVIHARGVDLPPWRTAVQATRKRITVGLREGDRDGSNI